MTTAYSISQTAKILTDKMHRQGQGRFFRGKRRGISEQVVRNMVRDRILPTRTIAGLTVILSDDLEALRFKLVGASRRDPVLYRVPRDRVWDTATHGRISSEAFVTVDGETLPVSDCLTADEIMAEYVRRERPDPGDVLAMRRLDAKARRYARNGNFIGSFRVRRNWLAPAAVKDGVAYALLELGGKLEPFAVQLEK